MYRLTWEKISKLDHYPRAGLVITTISVCLILAFVFMGLPAELIFLNGLILKTFATASIISHLYSNATYIAGTIDLFKKPTDKNKVERWMTLIFIIIGISSGLFLSFTLAPVTFFSFLTITTVTTGAFSGLGSRIGGLGRRHWFEAGMLISAGVVGAFIGLSLVLAGTPIINIAGIISFITGSNPVLAPIISVCIVTSLFMSGADYFSKMLRYACKSNDDKQRHEYEGSFIGALFSVCAIVYFWFNLDLISSVEGTQKLIEATTVALFAKCFGIDGICSRIGRTLDNTFDEGDTLSEKFVKGFLVLSGIAGLMVVADMVCTAADKLRCARKPAAPAPNPRADRSLYVIIEGEEPPSPKKSPENNNRIQITEPSSPDFYYCFPFWKKQNNDNKVEYLHKLGEDETQQRRHSVG